MGATNARSGRVRRSPAVGCGRRARYHRRRRRAGRRLVAECREGKNKSASGEEGEENRKKNKNHSRTLDLQFRTIDSTGTDQLNRKKKNLFIPNVVRRHHGVGYDRHHRRRLPLHTLIAHRGARGSVTPSHSRRVIDVLPTAGF